jgi:hypothetical protein
VGLGAGSGAGPRRKLTRSAGGRAALLECGDPAAQERERIIDPGEPLRVDALRAWEHTQDAGYAVRHGLALTGKVVMAAAIIMISVFGSFVLGDDHTIKLFGVGLASAILFDAFVIRLVLVPALMHVFGRASWWMPAALDRRLPRLSIEGPQVATQET